MREARAASIASFPARERALPPRTPLNPCSCGWRRLSQNSPRSLCRHAVSLALSSACVVSSSACVVSSLSVWCASKVLAFKGLVFKGLVFMGLVFVCWSAAGVWARVRLRLPLGRLFDQGRKGHHRLRKQRSAPEGRARVGPNLGYAAKCHLLTRVSS